MFNGKVGRVQSYAKGTGSSKAQKEKQEIWGCLQEFGKCQFTLGKHGCEKKK